MFMSLDKWGSHLLDEPLLFQTLPTEVEDDRALKHTRKGTFSSCQDLYESGVWCYNVVFFFPCALKHAWGVGQCNLGSKWRRLFCVLVWKSAPQKRKKKKKTDVRWVCNWLISVGFFVACDVWEAKISFFDGLCACRLTLNHILYQTGTSKTEMKLNLLRKHFKELYIS